MNIIPTNLDGVFEIQNEIFKDNRGLFVKTMHENVFKEAGLDVNFKESFYSTSTKGVLRGMHFQLKPHEHSKLVYVINGEILDVVVDIRKNSPTFGEFYSTKLSGENAKSIYISKGFAHGFLTISEIATVVYSTSTVHNPRFDTGIHWNSFNYNWGINEKNIIISERDSSFIGIQEY